MWCGCMLLYIIIIMIFMFIYISSSLLDKNNHVYRVEYKFLSTTLMFYSLVYDTSFSRNIIQGDGHDRRASASP